MKLYNLLILSLLGISSIGYSMAQSTSVANRLLLRGACNNNLNEIKAAVVAGAEVNNPVVGLPALILSVIHKNLEMMEYLVDHRADFNAQDDQNDTALIWAARKNNLKMVRYLVKQGAHVNIQNNQRLTALIYAIKNDDILMAKCLLAHGAQVDPENREALEALYISALEGHLPLLKMIFFSMNEYTRKYFKTLLLTTQGIPQEIREWLANPLYTTKELEHLRRIENKRVLNMGERIPFKRFSSMGFTKDIEISIKR